MGDISRLLVFWILQNLLVAHWGPILPALQRGEATFHPLSCHQNKGYREQEKYHCHNRDHSRHHLKPSSGLKDRISVWALDNITVQLQEGKVLVHKVRGAPAANHPMGAIALIHTVDDDISEERVLTVTGPGISGEENAGEGAPGNKGGGEPGEGV